RSGNCSSRCSRACSTTRSSCRMQGSTNPMKLDTKNNGRRIAALAAALLLAGCASYQGIEPEAQFRTPESLGLPAGAQEPAAKIAPDRWRSFRDAQPHRLDAPAL